MGVVYTAITLLGAPIDEDQLYREVEEVNRIESCCKTAPSAARFCSVCGRKLVRLSYEPIEGFDPDSATFHGLQVVGESESALCYIGMMLGRSNEYEKAHCVAFELSNQAYEVRQILTDSGLCVAAEEFGLWTLLVIS